MPYNLHFSSDLKNLNGLKIGAKCVSATAFGVSMYLRNIFVGQYSVSIFLT